MYIWLKSYDLKVKKKMGPIPSTKTIMPIKVGKK